MMNWISVKDKLPEDNETVLLFGKGGRYITGCSLNGVFVCLDYINDSLEYAEEITHWMPLKSPFPETEY